MNAVESAMDGEEATDVVAATAAGRGDNSSGKQEQQQPKTQQQQNPKAEHLAADQDELLSFINELNGRGGHPKPLPQGLSAAGDPKKKVMAKKGDKYVVSEEVDLCPTSEARHLLLSLSIAEYEAQKERLLRLILKHNAENRACTHPDLVRVHPRPLEPGSDEVSLPKSSLYFLF